MLVEAEIKNGSQGPAEIIDIFDVIRLFLIIVDPFWVHSSLVVRVQLQPMRMTLNEKPRAVQHLELLEPDYTNYQGIKY